MKARVPLAIGGRVRRIGTSAGPASKILAEIARTPIVAARLRGTDTGIVLLPVDIGALREWARTEGLR